MKNRKHYVVSALVSALMIAAMLVSGCSWIGSSEASNSRRGDLIIDLGNKAKLRLVWIEPLQLFVGQYEISNKIFRRFKPEHNSGQYKQFSLNSDKQPAVNLSWNEAQQFCQWLNSNYSASAGQSYRFRLPTEQEWESFASCGQHTEYPWGSDWPPPRHWNYYGRENPEPAQKLNHNDGFRVSCPGVRSGKNAWRLFGVGGNVWEWCEDTDGDTQCRVFKGASWADCHPVFLQLSRRSSNAPEYRYITLGFRVVANPHSSGK